MKKIAILAVLFALVTMIPAISSAHDNDKTVMGNITKVDGMNLMVKGADGKEIMVMMDAKTKITEGAKKVDAKTLKVGDRVVASGPESQGMISAETVKLGAAPAAAPAKAAAAKK
jgi:outer membrane lipoprotein SlyB